MKPILLASLMAAVSCVGQNAAPEQLTQAARQLSDMSFDSGAPVTVQGRVGTLVWPEGGNGMILVEANGTRYAFSTARVAQMAKIGFTRFALHPGEEIIVTGVLSSGGQKIGPGFTAARADTITKSDGNRLFERSRLPEAK